MNTTYYNLSELAAAAKSCDCTAHLHIDSKGDAVFAVGSENIGAAEFNDFDAAMAWATDRAERDAGDLAEEAGAAIASECLDHILNSEGQALQIMILQNAILDVGRLPRTKRAAGGFSVKMAPFLALALAHAPRGGLDK